ncbi:hypothetical protein FTUN_4009 [Frigoriglobus tundricola]|uniref:Uncharacterized protein n=1 Tax=Frigoriglobus tundricola TaxID=2774151 RepID=A0A6M5YU56_9BACT|nr:hypothetical protein FTUN_4009 [Frigoriglobus tundricola]
MPGPARPAEPCGSPPPVQKPWLAPETENVPRTSVSAVTEK